MIKNEDFRLHYNAVLGKIMLLPFLVGELIVIYQSAHLFHTLIAILFFIIGNAVLNIQIGKYKKHKQTLERLFNLRILLAFVGIPWIIMSSGNTLWSWIIVLSPLTVLPFFIEKYRLLPGLLFSSVNLLAYWSVHPSSEHLLYIAAVFVIITIFTSLLIESLRAGHNLIFQNEQQLLEQIALTKQALDAKNLFLANVSHEIRTPLNAILGFVDLLRKKEDDVEKVQYLQTIDTSSHALLDTINDILDLTKIESGKLTIEKVDFNPREVFESTVKLFLPHAAKKHVQLSFECDDDIPKPLHSDILRIKQVVHKLLSNAIKFSNEGGKVTLKVGFDKKKRELQVSVHDEGIGIQKEMKDKIFDAFIQGDSSITREYGGTGLGLNISSKIVTLLGGSMSVESEEGKGSIFSFQVPVEKSTYAAIDAMFIQENVKLKGDVLIVEDNDTNQLLIKIILSERGLESSIAKDGLEAVALVKEKSFDLILMDENMPNLSGIGALQQIREYEKEQDLPSTPVIALTANALQGDKEKFLKAGMNDYLSKPIDINLLDALLAKYLKSDEL